MLSDYIEVGCLLEYAYKQDGIISYTVIQDKGMEKYFKEYFNRKKTKIVLRKVWKSEGKDFKLVYEKGN